MSTLAESRGERRGRELWSKNERVMGDVSHERTSELVSSIGLSYTMLGLP